ncbi:uncharacterized protein LOC132657631 [Ovis aries]|uniref:uncharacterized protein LOC132657631 n=1 Tax=Ovis aries TaxID=9940 RepID=UPI0029527D10|nr:uncharacterized protein LOC132657631 [Ovis aries]
MKVKSESQVAQSCLTPSDPMDCSLPGSSVHGIFQARVLEWGAIAFSDYTLEVRNRFKGLDLIDRLPDELWTEVRDIVQEIGIQTIPKKKKCQRAKWLSEEALQRAVKRREVKSKGEKERYSHLNAEFQRIPRRDKKAFFCNRCKQIKENNRMGKTRDLFKKIRDSKGTFHAKMGSVKDRNRVDLTEEDFKKRWQEYTKELYKKGLQDPDNHDGVITHLEPDILECEVKWTLGSITMNKASRGDGIPVELYQILKDDAVKVLHSICQQIWKTAVATGLEKVSFHSNPKERQCQRMLKLLHNCTHLTC